MREALALAVLAASLACAVARPRVLPAWALTLAGALLLLLTGAIPPSHARAELGHLGPTVGFLAALLVLAEGCRQARLFDALGGVMGRSARGSARRLLGMVFVTAAATTAVLSLDATVVLLTPVVLVTAARLRANPRPHLLACAHLSNSASLLLPVSNLTNLLAFQATGLSFLHFAGLMVLPWAAALATEWHALSRSYSRQLAAPVATGPPAGAPVSPPVVVVLTATLIGFALSSPLGVAPVWFAVAGALALALGLRLRPRELLISAQPGFLVFVLALGVVVRAAGDNGLTHAVEGLAPHGSDLPELLGLAALAAVLANLVNNLPATLILLPVVTGSGTGAVLAMLIGVGVGPNLTPVGSLATLLWGSVLHRHGEPAEAREFVRLGLLTVPLALAASTLALWLVLRLT